MLYQAHITLSGDGSATEFGSGVAYGRSRIKQLRALGKTYATENAKFGDVTVRVRLVGQQNFIHVESGGAFLLSGFVANGFPFFDAYDADGKFLGEGIQGAPDNLKKWGVRKFWPRDDLRKQGESGWLTKGEKPKKIANLDLSMNGTKLRFPPWFPFPDARASKYGKRAPASLYSGTMRKVVQVLLGQCNGAPSVDTTKPDNLFFPSVSNIDVPYDYTFSQSHGIFVASDHTKEKPNIWVIEISSTRGINAWRLMTKKITQRSNPDLYDALGFMPIATPRPVKEEDRKRLDYVSMGVPANLKDYFGHEGFFEDCGWAFSYSGKKAANVSVELVMNESLMCKSVWANLWEISFFEGVAFTDGSGAVRMGPKSVSLSRRDRKRMRMAVDFKVPFFNVDVGRTLISFRHPPQLDSFDADYLVFPVFVMFEHDSDSLKIIYARTLLSIPQPTIYSDDVNFSGGNAIRGNIRELRSGYSNSYEASGFIFNDKTAPNYSVSSENRNDLTIGGYTGFAAPITNIPFGVYCLPMYYVNGISYSFSKEDYEMQSIIIPFGDREAFYFFEAKVKSELRANRQATKYAGMSKGNALHAYPSDVWNDDGSYFGRRNTFYPVPLTELPTDQMFGSPSAVYIPETGGSYVVQHGTTPDWPPLPLDVESIPTVPEIVERTVEMQMTLFTSKFSIPVPTYGNLYGLGPEPMNVEQFEIPPDTMGSKLADVTSDAFTGAVSASEGIYRAGNYSTFIRYGTDYPANEIDFRFGYWVGIPHWSKTT